MKKIQYMEVERKLFQVKELTARESANMFAAYNNLYAPFDIYDAYKNPSEAKVSAWTEWAGWATDVNMFDDTYVVENIRICARNNRTFTVCAIIREFDEDEVGPHTAIATYIMKATKSHNYLYKLASDEDREDLDVCW